eukprot:7045090-Prymnesium_polylepis.1
MSGSNTAPPKSVTGSVAAAFGFERPESSTHNAVAAAAYAALHPGTLIKDMPAEFRSSQRCNEAWRSHLGPAIAKVLDGAAAQLRACRDE